MTQRMKWITLGVLGLLCAAGLVACGDRDGGTVTSPSPPSSALGAFETTGATSQMAGFSHSEDPSEDNNSDDNSSDDNSSDDNSSDDDSSDDNSSDDSSDDDSGGGNIGRGGDDDVRGLFFGFEDCSDCEFAVRIKDTVVAVTDETRIDNEPALAEGLTPDALEALLMGHEGLPMRARGTLDGGILRASRIRIDDEIRASGVVVEDASDCDVTLRVRDMLDLCFLRAQGVPDPPKGEARIEGVTPINFDEPFTATRIELSN